MAKKAAAAAEPEVAEVVEATQKEKDQGFSKKKTTNFRKECEHCGAFVAARATECKACSKPLASKDKGKAGGMTSGGARKGRGKGVATPDFERVRQFISEAGGVDAALAVVEKFQGFADFGALSDQLGKYSELVEVAGDEKKLDAILAKLKETPF